jgi:hypothetical protein
VPLFKIAFEQTRIVTIHAQIEAESIEHAVQIAKDQGTQQILSSEDIDFVVENESGYRPANFHPMA